MKAVPTTSPGHVSGSRLAAGMQGLLNNFRAGLSRWEWKWLVILGGGFVVIATR